jgi:trehalose synthase
MYEVNIGARSVAPFAEFLGRERIEALTERARTLRTRLGARAIWNINSTKAGGGVAEMLQSSLRYTRGLDIAARWFVLEGPPEFFRLTKRVHNALHGSLGDGSPLGHEQHALFERVSRDNSVTLDALIRPDDIVICHDPQTAGLVPHLAKLGARVIWRCHIGRERQDGEVDHGWEFLRPYLECARFAVFSRGAYAPPWMPAPRTIVLAPNIDPFSAKNQVLSETQVREILAHVGLIEGPPGPFTSVFTRDDGSIGRVDREAEVVRMGRAPSVNTPLVVQVSRWDLMKDPVGVLQGFVRSIDPQEPDGAQLVLAGPSIAAVADDPESAEVFAELETVWRALPPALRRTAHLALLPMQDSEENAAIVNALQRHAAVIVQKSLHEGFGLTVTEALWKHRPVVASAVGGISDQIRDGVDGLLVHDPTDLDEFARVLRRLLGDPALAERLGAAGYARVRDNYLTLSALEHWATLLEQLVN